jgi:hypothetical protein
MTYIRSNVIPEQAFHRDAKEETPMLSLAIVMLWTAFACAYLIWQYVSGDLSERSAVKEQRSAFSRQLSIGSRAGEQSPIFRPDR